MYEVGPQCKSDNQIAKQLRLIQSRYRANILREDFGCGPNEDSKNKYGNMLVNGERTGSNFVSPSAFNYAKSKVLDKALFPELTIDKYRLFNNMLSSQPMCFNMFSDLRDIVFSDHEEASRIIKSFFPEATWLKELECIDIEFIPTPISEYTDDKSAFDAVIIGRDLNNKNCLITIETKYSDILGNNSSNKRELKDRLVAELDLFSPELKRVVEKEGYNQLQRNFLLTIAYAKKRDFKNFLHVVISPSLDIQSKDEISVFQNGLQKYKDNILKYSLEDFFLRGRDSKNSIIKNLYSKLIERYFYEMPI